MKRLIPAGILLLIVIFTYIISVIYVNKSCEILKDYVYECKNAYESQQNIEENINKLDSLWKEREAILSVFVNHDKIDDMEIMLSAIKIYGKSNDESVFYEKTDAFLVLLQQIIADTKFSSHSIL